MPRAKRQLFVAEHRASKSLRGNFQDMQDRYTGDVGDYIKFALLRTLSPGMSLGVAWYLFPDEGHNADGKHVSYLDRANNWRHLDPELFDGLANLVASERSVEALEKGGVLDARFSHDALDFDSLHWRERSYARERWFDRVLQDLHGCDLVFADPDNGLVDDQARRRSRKDFGKRMPLGEAASLAHNRTAVIYHHNSRFPGGHDLEVDHWLEHLGSGAIAVRANAFSCRTFFILNPTPEIVLRARVFCKRWKDHKVSLHSC